MVQYTNTTLNTAEPNLSVREALSRVMNITNLNNVNTTEVITASAINTSQLNNKSVYVFVASTATGITGTATVNVEVSPDGNNWVVLDTRTIPNLITAYKVDIAGQAHYTRTIAKLATNTVTTIITGKVV